MHRHPTLIGFFVTVLLSAMLLTLVYTAHRPAHAQATFAPIQCNNFTAISSATSVQVVTAGNASSLIYICAVSVGSIGGSSFSIVEGTGVTCATNTTAMAGGTTAAAGYGIAANGSPVQFGGGIGPVMKTKTVGDNVCLIIAGTGPLAGTMASTQAPY